MIMLIGKLKKLISRCPKLLSNRSLVGPPQTDMAVIKIEDVVVTMTRHVSNTVPHEFSVYVPRVEIRQRYYRDNQLQYEKEMILSSLTIVHAPQHPPAESGRLPVMCQKMD